jgi:hypothetical protein
MDPAVYPAIVPPFEERAGVAFFSVRPDPVIDPFDAGQIFFCHASGRGVLSIGKADEDMGEDVLTVPLNPWHKIIRDPFLVPPPLLAALSALPAFLGHDLIFSGDCLVSIGWNTTYWFFKPGGLQEKTRSSGTANSRSFQPGSCQNPVKKVKKAFPAVQILRCS